jgi:hypothetical protein
VKEKQNDQPQPVPLNLVSFSSFTSFAPRTHPIHPSCGLRAKSKVQLPSFLAFFWYFRSKEVHGIERVIDFDPRYIHHFPCTPTHLHFFTRILLPSPFYITQQIPSLNFRGVGIPVLPGSFQLHLERKYGFLHNDSSDFPETLPPEVEAKEVTSIFETRILESAHNAFHSALRPERKSEIVFSILVPAVRYLTSRLPPTRPVRTCCDLTNGRHPLHTSELGHS